MADAREHAPRQLLLAAEGLDASPERHATLRPLSTPSRAHPLLLLSLSLRTSDPNGAVATVAVAVATGHPSPRR